ncbi:tRNA (adenosine(37)-N6)-threonylcarbamoyltransferase complex ATPase subunit type 1 TsaE [Flavobacteriaceae bacterium]|jgi:tRNA threonylcarbamoyladenosine biosynthesis protein TsaE|nr:tRNA (adenosine(37)-N6)-threonylcarbamoyltransferase complex ATPase subunit type 1 TsaE [Flavobacteriaceae bacterium]MDA7724270.1 tRNA (adenosine(37)-N6)-threonylcarbamoyltransferase complex ATPase subunit type 1 TsaE [Flavobacteriaceae bacterium]MDA7848543.1 tRNA (adenosine(37)-N6)-threonylcarbamoyltransferase complex ATPase subunit type 1 TsaE [Flavobacteriaceae bacterium]|tara:strand:+ start:25448 stop:25879 length:432 start_codon:yes stop_codon:yes gene_type:complete
MTKELHFKLEDLTEIAKVILKNVQSKTLLFYGEMGSGKTTLISAIVKEMGGVDATSSPTFSIVNEYEVKDDIVNHFDLYRLKNEYEALDMGIEDYFYSGSWNFIEWPEKIKNLLPENVTVLELSLADDGGRILKISQKKLSDD